MKKLSILIFVPFFCLAVSANAVTIVRVEGVVTSIEEYGIYEWGDSVDVGTEFSALIYYEDLIDQNPISNHGYYVSTGALVTVGDYVFNSTEGILEIVTGENFVPVPGGGSDTGYTFGNSMTSSGIIYENGQPVTIGSVSWKLPPLCNLVLQTMDPDIVPTDAFPLDFPDLSGFDYTNDFGIYLPGPDGNLYLNGEATSIEVIPEPCSLALLDLGAIGLLRRRR